MDVIDRWIQRTERAASQPVVYCSKGLKEQISGGKKHKNNLNLCQLVPFLDSKYVKSVLGAVWNPTGSLQRQAGK